MPRPTGLDVGRYVLSGVSDHGSISTRKDSYSTLTFTLLALTLSIDLLGWQE